MREPLDIRFNTTEWAKVRKACIERIAELDVLNRSISLPDAETLKIRTEIAVLTEMTQWGQANTPRQKKPSYAVQPGGY